MLVILILLFGAVLIYFFLIHKKTHSRKRHHKNHDTKQPHPYHSVTITTEAGGCQEAAELANKRFLSADAPPLPLANCQAAQCHCHYIHYEDRRDEHGSRRNHFGLSHDLFGGDGQSNRREPKKGRRQSDKSTD
jgi:ABC-type nickel/cobalt efflux system permease component RcnA